MPTAIPSPLTVPSEPRPPQHAVKTRGEQQRPHGREQVAEVLADRATGVLVEGLKGDRGGLASGGAHLRVEVGLGEVRDEERPASEPEELHGAREHSEDHAGGSKGTAEAESPRK